MGGHTLGLVHEHQRCDRDQYVKIHWENISDPEAGHVNWGKIQDTVTQGLAYDPNSVMHYGSDWQGKDGGAHTLEWLGNTVGATGNCIHYDCNPVVGWSRLSSNDAKAITAIHLQEIAMNE